MIYQLVTNSMLKIFVQDSHEARSIIYNICYRYFQIIYDIHRGRILIYVHNYVYIIAREEIYREARV